MFIYHGAAFNTDHMSTLSVTVVNVIITLKTSENKLMHFQGLKVGIFDKYYLDGVGGPYAYHSAFLHGIISSTLRTNPILEQMDSLKYVKLVRVSYEEALLQRKIASEILIKYESKITPKNFSHVLSLTSSPPPDKMFVWFSNEKYLLCGDRFPTKMLSPVPPEAVAFRRHGRVWLSIFGNYTLEG